MMPHNVSGGTSVVRSWPWVIIMWMRVSTYMGPRIIQLIRCLDLHSKDCRFEPRDRVFFGYGPLASLSLQITHVALEHHNKNNWGSNKWINCDHSTVVKVPPLPSREKQPNFGVWRVNKWLRLTDPQPPRTLQSVLSLVLHTRSAGALEEWKLVLGMVSVYYANTAQPATLLLLVGITIDARQQQQKQEQQHVSQYND